MRRLRGSHGWAPQDPAGERGGRGGSVPTAPSDSPPGRGLSVIDLPGLTRSQGTRLTARPRIRSVLAFLLRGARSKINCHVLFIDPSRDLGPARFPSECLRTQRWWRWAAAPAGPHQGHRVLGNPSPGHAAGLPDGPPRHASYSTAAPFPARLATSPAVPALTFIPPLPRAGRGRAQPACRFSFLLSSFSFLFHSQILSPGKEGI